MQGGSETGMLDECVSVITSPFHSHFMSVIFSVQMRSLSLQHGTMKGPELVDSASRFRFVESCLGLVGCLCVSYAVWTDDWLDKRGLWETRTVSNNTSSWSEEQIIQGCWAQRVFSALSFLMAVSSGILCLVFALCWTSRTVHSYSNMRSLLMSGQGLYPTTLLLITLTPTGFFFLLSWALFSHEHVTDIRDDITRLGSSYWLGATGWALLLAVVPAVFLVEQCMVTDSLPDTMRATNGWWNAPQVAYSCSFIDSRHLGGRHNDMGIRRLMSAL
ncbi:hypothetical protein P4O66_015808 [Electrophorus voltai]|uniref:Uncharacterized protein n=1 Tax=Electrophorus voltai TaxID=2609070 RepID=A0AAD8YZX3_9TELE|nr:hypothetical protein P4O66_015808 [Electrophorus voltai]